MDFHDRNFYYLIVTLSTPDLAGGKSQQFTIASLDSVFTFHKPPPQLANFVECFWIHEGSVAGEATEQILPTGTFELVINLRDDDLRFHDSDRGRVSRFSGAIISGAHSRRLAPADTNAVSLIGIHFKPGGAFPFLAQPAGELADTHVDLQTLWGQAARRVRERIWEAKTSAERFRVLEDAVVARMRDGVKQHYAVPAALEMFGNNHVGPKVREAAKYIGLSERRFIETFKMEVGLTPKLFSRIQRFQRTRRVIQKDHSPDWAELALNLGYFDQSHLIREFLEFSGVSPTEYLHRQRAFV